MPKIPHVSFCTVVILFTIFFFASSLSTPYNSIPTEYIISFKSYLWTSKHKKYLEKILETRDGYEVVERNNPSTQLFPSDFAVVKVRFL